MGACSLVLIVCSDLIRRIGSERFSLLAMSTLVVVGISFFYIPLSLLPARTARVFGRKPSEDRAQPVPLTLYMFVGWAVIRLVTSPAANLGMQNAALYIAFLGAIAATAYQSSAGTGDLLLRIYRRAGWVIGIIYGLTVVRSGPGNGLAYGPRTFSAVALIVLAAAIPASAEKRGRWLPVVLAALIALSLSRTAMAISTFLLVALGIRMRAGRRTAAVLVLGAIVIALSWRLVTAYAPIRDRFQGSGDHAVVGTMQLNTSGRIVFWTATWDDAKLALWRGRGTGTADALITQLYSMAAHPHNDYLRILHDLGLVGLGLWISAYLSLLRGAARRAWGGRDLDGVGIHTAATLALLSVGLLMITDNVLTYLFVMVPMGTLVGASLALPVRDVRCGPASHPAEPGTVP